MTAVVERPARVGENMGAIRESHLAIKYTRVIIAYKEKHMKMTQSLHNTSRRKMVGVI
jgi:hypothetical protein